MDRPFRPVEFFSHKYCSLLKLKQKCSVNYIDSIECIYVYMEDLYINMFILVKIYVYIYINMYV